MERRTAVVVEAVASPTPTPSYGQHGEVGDIVGAREGPSRTAREASRPAIEEQNACSESWVSYISASLAGVD